MADPVTDNLSLLLMATGTASGTWGSLLNTNVFTILDKSLCEAVVVGVSSSDVTLSTSQRQHISILLTGTLTNDLSVLFPMSPNSTTFATGGEMIFWNNTTGNFNVTVKSAASGSVGVQIPQGVRSLVYCNGINVYNADDGRIAKINSTAGNPNGSMTGTAASVNTPADIAIDRTNNIPYICTSSGPPASAVWSILSATFPQPGGYLTTSSSTNDIVITTDAVGATAIYYSPYVHGFIPIYNGISLTPVPFTQLTLTLSASSQVANGLYDVFAFLNPSNGAVTVGFGPAWTSAVAGSCTRGTGAGTTQLSRTTTNGSAGILVNTVQITANNGATTYTIASARATYLGTVWIDAAAGQVTCHRNYGQSRKFGIWNAYNRIPILLKAGDPNSSWAYSSTTVRASNGSSANSLTVLSGLAEEPIELVQSQRISVSTGATSGPTLDIRSGIGWNSTAAYSGQMNEVSGGVSLNFSSQVASISHGVGAPARFLQVPSLGINTVTSLESVPDIGGGSGTFYGTETNMVLSASWRG